ncbi:MAG: DEAD/DEAH box helicase, partial [Candidatus Obscuribacterales bacterium]|nr:DEAD/DEAH box helicase [Candidatus Obscuribacterales bacterium]
MISFEQLGLSKQALTSLEEVGFVEPTEIQAKTIGIVAQRKDLIASAQTGSGKTAAYVLPIIDILRSSGDKNSRAKTRALVIVPTRELALQVKLEFDRFSKGSGLRAVAIFGGTGYRPQVQALHRGADVIVATPGRLLDCAN